MIGFHTDDDDEDEDQYEAAKRRKWRTVDDYEEAKRRKAEEYREKW